MVILLMVILPILTGLILPFLKINKLNRNIYVVASALITSIIAFSTIINSSNIDFTILNVSREFSIGFKNDGLAKIFTMIVATLWPLATLYSTEYMEHEENQISFFRYYLIAYGITLGLAHSKNLITMYLFYELLTFLTLPLVMHKLHDKKSLYAGKVYLIVSILGASLALIGIIMFISVSNNIEFVYGGLVQNSDNVNKALLYASYILCFVGFGVKAAVVPFTFWLPLAGVAPTPVSALLHAVAVVKAGVFAIMRVTYFAFGAEILQGSIAQNVCLVIAITTIFYGSIMALKDRHIKRRLAYSTASNLSYILFSILLLTSEGFAAGILHMMFHAIIKINLFFAAGSIMIYAEKEYVQDVKGIAKKMPVTMFTFLVASLALVGIPLTCGFISKYAIITAAINAKTYRSMIGIIAIIISAILTVIYLFSIVINAYLPSNDFDEKHLKNVKEAGLSIKFVLIIITILIIYFGINSANLVNFVELVVKGIN